MNTKNTLTGIFASSLMLVSTAAFSEWQTLNGEDQSSLKMSVLNSTRGSTTLRYEIPGYDIEMIKINGADYSQVTVPGISSTSKKGLPELPRFSRNVMVPSSSVPNLKIISIETEELDLGPIAPSKGELTRNINPADVSYDVSSFYKSSGRYPAAPVKMDKPFNLRKVTGVNVTFLPFQYDAATGLTTVVKEMVVEISTPSPKGFKLFNKQGKMKRSFAPIYQNRFVNFPKQSKDIDPNHFIEEDGAVLVISHSDFIDGMTPWVEWKTQKGMDVTVVDVADIGSSYSSLKSYIQDAYDASGLTHVVLVGDAEFVPYHRGTSGNASGNEADPMYSLVDGTDSYPDLFVSRISVKNTTELDTVVTKLVAYEKTPDTEGDWYAKGVGIASNEGSPTDKVRAEWLREMLEGYHFTHVDKIYDPGASVSAVMDALDEGRSYINYIGHGSKTSWGTSRFSNSSISQLQNGHMLPHIVSVACVNGDFGSGSDAFAEAWMKAGSASQPKGAIAVFASSTNQSWVPPTVGQKEITNLLVTEQASTIGGLYFNGGTAVLEDNSSSARQTFQTWHIFGDSTLEVRTDRPVEIEATIPSSLTSEAGEYSLEVEAGVKVGLTVNGMLIGSARADNSGVAKITVNRDLQRGETAMLTLTGYNKTPLQVEVAVD